MRLLCACVLVLVLVLAVGSRTASAGLAASSRVKLSYSDMTFTAGNSGGTFGDRRNGLMTLEFARMKPSGWGFGGELTFGNQSPGGGIYTSLESGTDRFFNLYISRRITPPDSRVGVNLTGGWGKYLSDTTFIGGTRELFRSTGIIIGTQVYAPLSPNLALTATARFGPGQGVTRETGGVVTSTTSSVWDWRASLNYQPNERIGVEVGYREVKMRAGDLAGPGTTFRWSGWHAGVRVRF
jgi:opacity protein-like surface antigen